MPTDRRDFLQRLLTAGIGLCFGGASLGAASARATMHKVVRGDTLSGIAHTYGVTVRELKSANNLSSDLIRVGEELLIPGSATAAVLAPVIEATRKIRVDRNRWRYIVAHHSAIEKGNAAIYGAAHLRRGMANGLAYHFVIGNGLDSGDGEIEVGPRWTGQLLGGHVRSRTVNDHGIGICLVGNFENHPPTPRQRASMLALIDYLRGSFVSRNCEVTVHKWVDRNHTLCPGRHFPYSELRRRYRA